MTNDRFDIIPTQLAVRALRDNGYKNAAYAIAELMDNAIQAKATLVELFCAERQTFIEKRSRMRLEHIAVLDNGQGMNSEILRAALQFGNGTRLLANQHTGIGRFGMGLPASSISQCKRVEVWSWQNGVENAIYAYFDIDEIENGQTTDVPVPIRKDVPDVWCDASDNIGPSGTLVLWSKLDKCNWRSARTVIENSELLIGRIYRQFINDKSARIRLVALDIDNLALPLIERDALPNDPGYLMEHTSCPDPYQDTAMFAPFTDIDSFEQILSIPYHGTNYEVVIRYSKVKPEVRTSDNAGNKQCGTHAKNNIGVSLMRARRELDLDQSLVRKDDTRERWWGVEIDFPPALDDVFGVTNNKQSAVKFTEMASNIKTRDEDRRQMHDDEDPNEILFTIVQSVNVQLEQLRLNIKDQTVGYRGSETSLDTSVEKIATERNKQREADGHVSVVDTQDNASDEDREKEIVDTLVEKGVTKPIADKLAKHTISDGLQFVFAKAGMDTPAFFSIDPAGGVMTIVLNTRHPAYDTLVNILEDDVEGADASELSSRLTKSLKGLKLLLIAWARYERELADKKSEPRKTRIDWGSYAEEYMKDIE